MNQDYATSKKNEPLAVETSMEEILASIRSIISDDVKQSTRESIVMEKKVSADSKNHDVLDLTEMLEEDGSIVSIQDAVPSSEPRKKEDHSSSSSKNVEKEFPLKGNDFISNEAFLASTQALRGLDSVSEEALQEVGKAFSGGKTLELLMVDVLRPMLKEWIDANLPSLVKVIVNEQVERVMQARRVQGFSRTDPSEDIEAA